MAQKKSAAPKSAAALTRRSLQAGVKTAANEADRPPDGTSLTSSAERGRKSAAAEKRAQHRAARKASFPVVGIGASAGGLEAFRELLDHLQPNTGMAFVLVQHLDPTHESILTELLSRNTRMPVTEVSDGMAVEPDHVYVIPPNTNMAISDGVLRLLSREQPPGRHRPIDYFLRTLAQDQSHRAIGVILSGTASDGTLGLEAIKAEGGITLAQEGKSAKYDNMPRSAIAAGHVDFILTPEEIAAELGRISRHPYLSPPAGAATPVPEETLPAGRNGFRQIVTLLRKVKGVDFTGYKFSTLHRRITRRLLLNRLERLEDYARYLLKNTTEVEALYQDLLIHVTSFFRDPETFAVLKERILPRFFEQRAPDEPVRVWVLGCSTGEEAYSIAISFVELAEHRGDRIPIQIFATDPNDRCIEKARLGLYSKGIAEDVSPERLSRFFMDADSGYSVRKAIRDMVVFARQNVLADPPFSRLDLISCRNLLIYLEPALQNQVLPTLHYALKPAGVLWLGSSETAALASGLFTTVDQKHRFYSKRSGSPGINLRAREVAARQRAGKKRNYLSEEIRTELEVQEAADRILLARYSPAGVLINAELEILQFRGSTAAYLESPPGKATLNVLKMAREGLMLPLRKAIQEAAEVGATIRKEDVRVNYAGESHEVNLEVIPIKGLAANDRCFLVLFERAGKPRMSRETRLRAAQARRGKPVPVQNGQEARLQEELAATREYMQSLVEQHDAADDGLRFANEEVQSSNEELQSINEELETAKEELESSNEELATLNDDLNNLFDYVNLPVLMLGRDLRLRRFTPQAERVLRLLPTDVGRLVNDFQRTIIVPDLDKLVTEAIDTASGKEREVQDGQGHWYLLRIRPYRTVDNAIDGAVVVLVDIDDLKNYYEAIVETIREPLLVLDEKLRVRVANRSFYDKFQVAREETKNQFIYNLGNRQWDIPALRMLLEEIVPNNEEFQDFEVEHDFENIGRKTMLLNARRLEQKSTDTRLILLTVDDITERRQAEDAFRQRTAQFETLLNEAPLGVYLVDGRFRIRQVNPAALTVFENIPDLIGRDFSDVIHILRSKEYADEIVERFRHTLATGEPYFVPERIEERRDNSGCTCYEWQVNRIPLHEGGYGVVCYIRDITARVQARDAIAESEQRFRQLADAMPQIVWTARPDGYVDYYNRRWFEYTGCAETYGMESWEPILHPDDLKPTAKKFFGCVRAGEPYQMEFRLKDRFRGGYRWFMGRALPIKNEKGEIVRWFGTCTDIDDIKRAEQQREHLLLREEQARLEAEATSRLKDEFLAMVSHELRTPLSAILGWAQMLRRRDLDSESYAGGLETIEKNAKLQARIIEDLLDISRIIAGKVRLDARPVELVPVIEAAIDLLRPAADAKDIRIQATLNPQAGQVSGDPSRLQQIVWNLLSNAVKFTPRAGRVRVCLERVNSHVEITVSDTGIGIEPEFLSLVFDRFRQADSGLTRSHTGLGLGLAIVRHLVELHGGAVRAESPGKNRGATFTVKLPRLTFDAAESVAAKDRKHEHRSAEDEAPLECPPASLEGVKVLVVDDEPDARKLLAAVLGERKAAVIAVASAAEALSTLDAFKPDVMVSDVEMPGEDGYSMIRKVRAMEAERGWKIPAAALTAHASHQDRLQALASGFQVHIPKPVELSELVATVATLAGRTTH